MKETVYLIFDENGVKSPIVKSTKAIPKGKCAVRLEVNINDSFFKNIYPTAKIEISEENILRPKVEIKERKTPFDEFFQEGFK